jgi:hypothetical protein
VNEEISALLELQSDVISRRQALDAGFEPHDIRRLLRRSTWKQVHRGVYVGHTGSLSWMQHAWAAVLWASPAALWGETSLRALDHPAALGSGEVLHLGIARDRSGLRAPPGVVLHHDRHLATKVQWNASPPRVRVDDAVIDTAISSGADLDAIAVLARWAQRRRTTPHRLLAVLAARRRTPRRTWLQGVLIDHAEGTCSVLEHGFLVHVETRHRLPRAARQLPSRSAQGLIYRDADYGALLVELDGRLFHGSPAARDADLERDLDAAVSGRGTLRLGWRQVFDRPCSTAAKLVTVMRNHGIDVCPSACGPDCPVE